MRSGRVGTALAVVGVVGGLLWVGHWAAGDAVPGDALLWAGAALVSVLAVAAGAALVKPPPLRAVVGLCFALLCWSLAAVVGLDDEPLRAGIAGLVVVVITPVAWERVRPLPGRGAPVASGPAATEAVPSGPRRRADRRSRSAR